MNEYIEREAAIDAVLDVFYDTTDIDLSGGVTMNKKILDEKPCVYKHTCGFEYCNMSDCPYYEPKTKGRKWAEQEADNGE